MAEHIATLAMAEGVKSSAAMPLTVRATDDGVEVFGAVVGPRHRDQSRHVATVPAGHRPEHTLICVAVNTHDETVGEFRVHPSGEVHLTPRQLSSYYLFPRSREWFYRRTEGPSEEAGLVVDLLAFIDRAMAHDDHARESTIADSPEASTWDWVRRDRARSAATRRIIEQVLALACGADAEQGCVHDVEALRAGGRPPQWDGDEFEPIQPGCLAVNEALPVLRQFASMWAQRPDYRPEFADRFPCGHTERERGCGGCDPGAVEYVRDDGGPWRRVGD